MSKFILTDCDGVLLDWAAQFDAWALNMKGLKLVRTDVYDLSGRYDVSKEYSKQLSREFNNSSAAGFIPPFRDAVEYVALMHYTYGYKFRVITSFSKDPWSIQMRKENLRRYFGDAIESLVSLDTGADKDEELAPYADQKLYWIEDKPSNATAGYDLGLKSLLIEHDHNANENVPYPIVKSWKEIFDIVV